MHKLIRNFVNENETSQRKYVSMNILTKSMPIIVLIIRIPPTLSVHTPSLCLCTSKSFPFASHGQYHSEPFLTQHLFDIPTQWNALGNPAILGDSKLLVTHQGLLYLCVTLSSCLIQLQPHIFHWEQPGHEVCFPPRIDRPAVRSSMVVAVAKLHLAGGAAAAAAAATAAVTRPEGAPAATAVGPAPSAA